MKLYLEILLSETDFFFNPKKLWWEAQLQAEQDRCFEISFVQKLSLTKLSSIQPWYPRTLSGINKSATEKNYVNLKMGSN